jgi:hypothetical protein
MQYSFDEEGVLRYLYGIPAVEALGSVFKSSFNTYIGQRTLVVAINHSETLGVASLNVVRNSGARVSHPTIDEAIRIPAKSVRVIDITDAVGANDYGVITLMPVTPNSISGSVLRVKEGDYVLATPLR